jgi:hypothetical protein
MKKLFITFWIDLCDLESEHAGAIFHRWLPNGGRNAINLTTNDPSAKLKVWFERCGYTDDNFIRYDVQRREVNPKIITKQGCLYSGPLFGKLEIKNLAEEKIQIIRDSKKGDEKYVNLINRLIKKLIYPAVSEFIERIRTNFGQFWIKQIPKYDSRYYSLGYYASHILNMKWSLDGGKKWNIFDPDPPDVSKATFYALPHPDYKQFLNKKDWQSISTTKSSNKSSNILLIRAHRLYEEGDLRLAFIEAVTALELSIHEFIRKRSQTKMLIKSSEAFYGLPLRTQLTVLCSSLEKISRDQIENSIKAIDIRNDIVHRGLNPKNEDSVIIYDLLRTVSYLSGNEVRKFPSNRFSTSSIPVKNWPKLYQRTKK